MLEVVLNDSKAHCSINLLNDQNCIEGGVAPSLSKDYLDAIQGLKIGPNTGSCGTAMYKKELVIVEDIKNSRMWQDYLSISEKFGLQACWSNPIID